VEELVKSPKKSVFSAQHQRRAIPFALSSDFSPAGDQPRAVEELDRNLNAGIRYQTLHGITGSGKTYTVANVIERQGRPALIMAPNKTLAAQLYHEFKEFFPGNRVRYFVSYYDYYQPEAYVPATDTYIEKDSAINEEIDKMRHAATKALLETTDAIIVASVSCIYGLGAPEDYFTHMLFVEEGQSVERTDVVKQLVSMQYNRSDIEFKRGTFRVRGEILDIFPSDQDKLAIRVIFFGDEIEELFEIDSLTGKTLRRLKFAAIYPVSHFVTGKEAVERAVKSIKAELEQQLTFFERQGKFLEAQRLEQRTMYDMELLLEIGFCSGIENYSRHLDGRPENSPPSTLLDYFPENFLLIVDESHVTVPQIGGMFRGDRARKQNLVDYGFRLPSALDNRPLNFEEFWDRVGQTIFVSATPGTYEREHSGKAVVELINRPTGLLDPVVEIRPAKNQVDDLLHEIHSTIKNGHRVLVTTLTKRMAEDFSTFLRESGVSARYLHSDIKTLERVEILRGLRKGEFDVLIGINLLREGLDLVEVALVAILDADREGFLRSETSLIQTIGRAARNLHGKAILYADTMTGSIQAAVQETDRRRKIQEEYNRLHGIVPRSVQRSIEGSLGAESEIVEEGQAGEVAVDIPNDPKEQQKLIERLKRDMFDAAAKRDFEAAAALRDRIQRITTRLLAA
jgi:excinuclease ABC subunit B